MSRGYRAVILGAGNLGRALINNFPFRDNGFELLAAFDNNPAVIGTEINGIQVLSMDDLNTFMAKNNVSVGIMTVPRKAAQNLAQTLADGGVKGIWNFTNTEISVTPADVIVESIHFADSLLALSYLISNPSPEK